MQDVPHTILLPISYTDIFKITTPIREMYVRQRQLPQRIAYGSHSLCVPQIDCLMGGVDIKCQFEFNNRNTDFRPINNADLIIIRNKA
jgi:hypothetical protein